MTIEYLMAQFSTIWSPPPAMKNEDKQAVYLDAIRRAALEISDNPELIRKATTLLVSTWKQRTWPTPADVSQAMRQARMDTPAHSTEGSFNSQDARELRDQLVLRWVDDHPKLIEEATQRHYLAALLMDLKEAAWTLAQMMQRNKGQSVKVADGWIHPTMPIVMNLNGLASLVITKERRARYLANVDESFTIKGADGSRVNAEDITRIALHQIDYLRQSPGPVPHDLL